MTKPQNKHSKQCAYSMDILDSNSSRHFSHFLLFWWSPFMHVIFHQSIFIAYFISYLRKSTQMLNHLFKHIRSFPLPGDKKSASFALEILCKFPTILEVGQEKLFHYIEPCTWFHMIWAWQNDKVVQITFSKAWFWLNNIICWLKIQWICF